jgi:RNA polymerase sigma factor (sigma-70 family)
MYPLVELAWRYRSSPDMDVRLQAAEELIKAMGPSLWLFIAQRCRNAATAEDAYQEALQEIVRRLPAFCGSSDRELWSYCYRIALGCVADEYRGGWAKLVEMWDPEVLRETLAAGAGDEPDSAETKADLEVMLELLQSVKPPCRDLLWMRYIDELEYKMIGKAYRISAAAAKVRVYRCLELAQKLARKLDK